MGLVSLCLHVAHPCTNYALTTLLFSLCRFVWIIDLLVTRPSPHPKVLACPSTLEMLQTREHTRTFYPSVVFTFELVVESTKEFGGASIFARRNLQEWKPTRWKRLYSLSYNNIAPNAKSKTSVSKTKGLEGFTWIKSGVVVKEACKDWKAFSSSIPHEKGWSFWIKQVRGVLIV